MSKIPPPGYTDGAEGPRKRTTVNNDERPIPVQKTVRKFHKNDQTTNQNTRRNSHQNHHQNHHKNSPCNTVFLWIIGIIIIFGSTYCQYQNTLSNAKLNIALDKAGESITEFKSGRKSMSKLVHLTSPIEITGALPYDPIFSFSPHTCVKMKRSVEMFQWQETENTSKDENGNEFTDYTYKPIWSSGIIKSSDFFEKTDHSNPSFEIKSQDFTADRVSVDGVKLGKEFIDKIDWEMTDFGETAGLKEWSYRNRYDISKTIPIGTNHKIGDYRVKWTFLGSENDVISAIGTVNRESGPLHGYELKPYKNSDLPELALLSKGAHNSFSMIKIAKNSADSTHSMIKMGLVFLTMIGFVLASDPVTSLLGYLPFFGGILQSGVVLIAVVLSLVWSGVVIFVSCILVNPMWVVSVVLGFVGLAGLKKASESKNVPKTEPNSQSDAGTSRNSNFNSNSASSPYPEPSAPSFDNIPFAGMDDQTRGKNIYPDL